MGGTGSGRWGGRPTVESALKLDINDLFRKGVIRRDVDRACRWSWANSHTSQTTAEVVMVPAFADHDMPHLRLIHREDTRTIADYIVDLTSTVQPFGGVRWWFECPVSGRRVGTLHLPQGATRFASRQAYRLGFYSQRCSPRYRAVRKMHKITRRLGGDPGQPSRAIEKPAGMHGETFDREMAKLREAEAAACAYLLPAIEGLRGRLMRDAAKTATRAVPT